MRIGIISDLHWKISRKDNTFLRHVEAAVDNFIEKCRENKVDMVINCGDTFHVKQSVDTYCLDRCLNSMRKLMSEFPTFSLVGNHETIRRYDNSINLMRVFENDCTVVTDYQNIVDINHKVVLHFVPYFDDVHIRTQKIPEVKEAIDERPDFKHILFGHFSFRGFDFTEGHENVWSELRSKEFLDLGIDWIFSGHIHSYQTIDRTTYISSPLESHFNEGGQHGFVFLDINEPENHTFEENELSPRFVHVELTRETLPDILKMKNAYLSVVINKEVKASLVEALEKKLKANNHFVRIEVKPSGEKGVGVIEGWDNYIIMSPDEIVEDFVKKSDLSNVDFTADELINEVNV